MEELIHQCRLTFWLYNTGLTPPNPDFPSYHNTARFWHSIVRVGVGCWHWNPWFRLRDFKPISWPQSSSFLLTCSGSDNDCTILRAVLQGHVKVVEILLEYGGADPEIGYICGDDPLLEYTERQLEGGEKEPHRPGFAEVNQLLRKWSKKEESAPRSGVLEQLWALWR